MKAAASPWDPSTLPPGALSWILLLVCSPCIWTTFSPDRSWDGGWWWRRGATDQPSGRRGWLVQLTSTFVFSSCFLYAAFALCPVDCLFFSSGDLLDTLVKVILEPYSLKRAFNFSSSFSFPLGFGSQSPASLFSPLSLCEGSSETFSSLSPKVSRGAFLVFGFMNSLKVST